jgi:hypothetical protein
MSPHVGDQSIGEIEAQVRDEQPLLAEKASQSHSGARRRDLVSAEFYAVSENDACNGIVAPISTTRVLRRGLS